MATARGTEGLAAGVAERPGDIEPLGESGHIPQGPADVIVHRLFAVGLDLHAALTYIEAGIADDVTIQKIHKAIGGLDGAIRDFRGVVLDLHPEGPDGPLAQAGLRALIVEAVERACAPGGGCPVLTLGHGMEAVIDRPDWQQVARLVHRTLTLVPGEHLRDTHVVVTADPRPPTRLVMHIDGPVGDLAGRLRAVEQHSPREDDRHWRDMDFSCQDVPRYPERSRIRLEWCMSPQ